MLAPFPGQYIQTSTETPRTYEKSLSAVESVAVGRSAHGQTAATDYDDEDDESLAARLLS